MFPRRTPVPLRRHRHPPGPRGGERHQRQGLLRHLLRAEQRLAGGRRRLRPGEGQAAGEPAVRHPAPRSGRDAQVRSAAGSDPQPLAAVRRFTTIDKVELPRIEFTYHSPVAMGPGDAEMDLRGGGAGVRQVQPAVQATGDRRRTGQRRLRGAARGSPRRDLPGRRLPGPGCRLERGGARHGRRAGALRQGRADRRGARAGTRRSSNSPSSGRCRAWRARPIASTSTSITGGSPTPSGATSTASARRPPLRSGSGARGPSPRGPGRDPGRARSSPSPPPRRATSAPRTTPRSRSPRRCRRRSR